MKPILSMKDDILVHEGDIIEDIIFIKKGRLSLEADINLDLDCPKNNNFEENPQVSNSISKRMSTLSYFQTINQTKNEEKNFNFSYLNLTTKKTNNTIIIENKQ